MRNTTDIRGLLDQYDKAVDALGILRDEAAKLRLNGHQDDVQLSIHISGRKGRGLTLATSSRETNYASAQVRGMEMIMLGVKKWYAAEIERHQQHVKRLEERIRESAQ